MELRRYCCKFVLTTSMTFHSISNPFIVVSMMIRVVVTRKEKKKGFHSLHSLLSLTSIIYVGRILSCALGRVHSFVFAKIFVLKNFPSHPFVYCSNESIIILSKAREELCQDPQRYWLRYHYLIQKEMHYLLGIWSVFLSDLLSESW